jgi:predicted CoA-binding protein
MAKIDTLVREFLDQKKIAVVGVSDRRETGSNASYRKLKAEGYTVYPVNPRLKEFDGDPCYPDLKSIPEKPQAAFILASPHVTEEIVRQCVDLGIHYVWMHCLLGTRPGIGQGMSSVSPSAVEMCQKAGIAVIPGSCPIQFLKPDVGHAMMRGLWRTIGFLKID